MERKLYPSDVRDEEWSFVAPYLTLMTEEATQREHDLLSEIAMSLGFFDQSHFTNSFKRLVGVTPQRFLQLSSKIIQQERTFFQDNEEHFSYNEGRNP